MICPVCNHLMIVLELNKVEIDYCPECRGIWLDSGELETLLDTSLLKNKLLNSFAEAKNVKERIYNCPICFRKMTKVYCGDDKNVLIDRCKKHHGLWFDKGELEKVISLGSIDAENKVLNLLKDMFKYNLSSSKA